MEDIGNTESGMADKVQEVRETTTTNGNATEKKTEVYDPASTVEKGGNIVVRIIWFIASIVIGLLVLRFILLLFGANPGNAFADFVYDTSRPLAAPFFGLFNYDGTITGNSYFELASLVAIAVYTLIASLLTRLFTIGR